jgi:hypothetical protein
MLPGRRGDFPEGFMAHMAPFLFRALAMAAPLALLAACDSSQRFGGYMPGGNSLARSAQASPPPPLTAAPSLDDADTQTLPPPPGSGAVAGTAPLSPPTSPSLTTGLPSAPGSQPVQSGVATAPGNLPRVATAPTTPTAPAVAPSRTSVTGNWSLMEAAGNRCRITLSSAPKLDLYGAGTNGCRATELQRVNAWELSGSEVILYESGGAVVARLRQSGDGSFSGVSTRSGAPVSMSK